MNNFIQKNKEKIENKYKNFMKLSKDEQYKIIHNDSFD